MLSRVARELRQLSGGEPVPGIACWLVDEADLSQLEAAIEGSTGTPYAGGVCAIFIINHIIYIIFKYCYFLFCNLKLSELCKAFPLPASPLLPPLSLFHFFDN